LNLLLDTHIWLWTLENNKRLGKRVAEEVRNPLNLTWISRQHVGDSDFEC